MEHLKVDSTMPTTILRFYTDSFVALMEKNIMGPFLPSRCQQYKYDMRQCWVLLLSVGRRKRNWQSTCIITFLAKVLGLSYYTQQNAGTFLEEVVCSCVTVSTDTMAKTKRRQRLLSGDSIDTRPEEGQKVKGQPWLDVNKAHGVIGGDH